MSSVAFSAYSTGLQPSSLHALPICAHDDTNCVRVQKEAAVSALEAAHADKLQLCLEVGTTPLADEEFADI